METTHPAYTYQSDAQRGFNTPQDYYRLRDFGQKFEATVSFLRKHGPNLYRVLLVPMILSIAPLALIMYLFGSNLASFQRGDASALWVILPAVFGLLVVILGAYIAQYTMIFGFVKRRMYQPDAQPLTAGEVWAEGRSSILPMIGNYFVAVILVIIGFVFLILPGFYVSVILLSFLPCVVVFENNGLGNNISRCFALAQGKWWSTFGLSFVASMAIGLISGGIGVVLTVIVTLFNLKSQDSTGAFLGVMLVQAVQTGINLLLYPILHILLMFQYFNLVERHDHVSLQWQAELLGQTPAAPVAAPDDTLFRPSYGDQTL